MNSRSSGSSTLSRAPLSTMRKTDSGGLTPRSADFAVAARDEVLTSSLSSLGSKLLVCLACTDCDRKRHTSTNAFKNPIVVRTGRKSPLLLGVRRLRLRLGRNMALLVGILILLSRRAKFLCSSNKYSAVPGTLRSHQYQLCPRSYQYQEFLW